MIPKKVPAREEIIDAINDRPQREAAEIIDISVRRLRKFMHSYGIKTRTRQEAVQLDRRYKCAKPHVSSRKRAQIHFKLITEVDKLKRKPTIIQCKRMAEMPFSCHDIAEMWETRRYRMGGDGR